jgi:hypothetical protein
MNSPCKPVSWIDYMLSYDIGKKGIFQEKDSMDFKVKKEKY